MLKNNIVLVFFLCFIYYCKPNSCGMKFWSFAPCLKLVLLLLLPDLLFGQSLCPITTSNVSTRPNTNVQLNASGADYYRWTPSTGLTDPTIANPIANVSVNTTYTVTGYTENSSNLIVNGDFENGNVSFSTSYRHLTTTPTSAIREGNYAILTNPNMLYPAFCICTDHTSGFGNMFVADGSTIAKSQVWGQTIAVKPNKDYAFYAYVTPVVSSSPPVLQFSINGQLIGTPFFSPGVTKKWYKFYAIWHSDAATTTANISIVDQNIMLNGNNFALDDIRCLEICPSANTVAVAVGPFTSTTNMAICSSNLPYVWNGLSCNNPGTYTTHLTTPAGCDSVATLNLTVKQSTYSKVKAEICQGDAYLLNGVIYKSSGVYTQNLTNAAGCDSIVTFSLKVKQSTASMTTASICQGDAYRFNGISYNAAGTYVSHLVNAAGCDSAATLQLKVNVPSSVQLAAAICDGDTYYLDNKACTVGGTYVNHLLNLSGCDSVVALNLTVNATFNVHNNILLMSGDSYHINGHEYTEAGTYTDVMKTTVGCDSTVVTDVTVVEIPNTITPNGDGHNDLFMKGWHVQVFNRNGIKLYDGMDGWNGMYNNKLVSKDTYFYVLYYTFEAETKIREGYLMVVR